MFAIIEQEGSSPDERSGMGIIGMRVVTPDLVITAVEHLVPGDVFVDPADEKRHVADEETARRYRSGYLVIKEEVPVMSKDKGGKGGPVYGHRQRRQERRIIEGRKAMEKKVAEDSAKDADERGEK